MKSNSIAVKSKNIIVQLSNEKDYYLNITYEIVVTSIVAKLIYCNVNKPRLQSYVCKKRIIRYFRYKIHVK